MSRMEKHRRSFMADENLYDPEMLAIAVDHRVGHIRGNPVGKIFATRWSCSKEGVHPPLTAGIYGDKSGAFSICMSDGYEDNVDQGDFIIYTGTGGHGGDGTYATGSQTKDQYPEHDHNVALKISQQTKRPVRVIRGSKLKSPYAPASGYRYDGLYIVERAYMDKGLSGYEVCKYELRRVLDQDPLPGTVTPSV